MPELATPQPQHAPPVHGGGAGTTTTAAGGGAAPSPGQLTRSTIRTELAGTPWIALCGSLLSDPDTAENPPPRDTFADGVYRLLADALDPQPLLQQVGRITEALASSPDRQPYSDLVREARGQFDEDLPRRQLVFDDVADLIAGGDQQFDTRRIMGNHGALSLRGKRWFREAPRATERCLGAFDRYVQGDSVLTHGAGGLEGEMFASMRAQLGEPRRRACQALYNLLRTGSLSGEVEAPAAAAGGATPEQQAQWREQAETLKQQIRDACGDAPTSRSGRARERRIDARRFREVMEQIRAAPVEVRDLVNGDAEIGRLIVDASSEGQAGELLRALDPVEALFNACWSSRGGIPPDAAEGATGAAVYGGGSPYDMIRGYLLAHPGEEGRAARSRVLQHTRLKDEFIDTLSDEQNRLVYRLIARGTDRESGEDIVHRALRDRDAVAAVRGLQRLAAEEPARLRELQDDQIFFHSISQLNDEVEVDGVRVRPFHLCLTMWGRAVGNPEDPLAGPMQSQGLAGAEERPLNMEERQQLDRELFDPAIATLADELDDFHTSDSTVMGALNTFARRAAADPLLTLIRRSQEPPGPKLAEKYNLRTGRSLRNDIRSGCDEDNSRDAERIIGATGDSATMGTIGNQITRAGDAQRGPQGGPEGATIGLEQALRETLHDGRTITEIIHASAVSIKAEVDEWFGADESDVRAAWDRANNAVTAQKETLEQLTGLTNRIHTAELLRNAYTEVGGSLSEAMNRAFSGAAKDRVCNFLEITPQHDAQREALRIRETGEVAPDHSMQRAEDLFASPATELFQALSAVSAYSEESQVRAVGTRLREARALRLAAGDTSLHGVAMPAGAAGPPAQPATQDTAAPTPQTFDEWYRRANGIDPALHAQMIARAVGSRSSERPARTIAEWLGIPTEGLDQPIATPDAATEIAAEDRQLVRPDFTIAVANHNAAEMWRILHEGGELRLITSVLYGPYNDTEQRYIAAAFRRLSGGADFHFYVRQIQEQNRRTAESGGQAMGIGFTMVGAEGTAAGQEVTTESTIRVLGDATDLETALSVGSAGVITARTRVSTAVGNRDMNQLFRVVDDLSDAECRQIIADQPLMARMQAFCDEVAWDRIYRTLMGMGTLRDALESRAHGDYGFWGFADATDETGMREDIRNYVRRVRRRAEEDIRREGRESRTTLTPEQIGERVTRRVRDACRDLLANPDVEGILRDELSGYDLSQTEGLLFNAGEENAAAQLIHDGDWSESEDDIIAAIGRMSPDERRRRAQDPEFLRRLGDLCDTEEQFRDAMNALNRVGGGEGGGGSDHLAALDTASRSEHEITGEMSRDENAIIDNLTQLTPEEYQRLQSDPRLMAQVLHGLDDDPEERELARRLMAFRFGDTAGNAESLGLQAASGTGEELSPEEIDRLAYLKHNATERMRFALDLNWDDALNHAVEVFRMNLRPNMPGAPAGAPPADAAPGADTPRPRTPQQIEHDLRQQIYDEIASDVRSFARREHARIEITEDSIVDTLRDAVMAVRDPSSARLAEQLGIWNDDDDGVVNVLRAASDDVLINEWTTVKSFSPHMLPSLRDVYQDYKTYREARAQASAQATEPGQEQVAVIQQAPDGTMASPVGDASRASPQTVTQPPQGAQEGQPQVTDTAAGTERREEIPEDPELQRLRLAYMNYVIDLSNQFEMALLPNAGGAFSDSSLTSMASREERQAGRALAATSVRDNPQWHEWSGIIRERIPNLDVQKIAVAIGAEGNPEDVELIRNPNRTARTQQQFRTYRVLQSRGEDATGILDIGHDEGENVDQAMARYGREMAEIETNDEGAYGIITEEEGQRTEERYGGEVDRALSAYQAAKAAVADWAALIVGLVITAVITILTAGVATGPAAAILIGALTAAASATGQALTREAIQGADYDFSREGLSSIAQATITGIITAGTTYYAQSLIAGLSSAGTLAQQATAAQQVLRTQPSIWRQLLTSTGEEVASEAMSGTIDAGIAAMNPDDWMHGFRSGARRASGRVEAAVNQIPGRVLQAGVTSIVTFGATQLRGALAGNRHQIESATEALAEAGTRRIDVAANFREYFGDQGDTITEAFTGWLVETGMSGNFPDISSVPASLVRAYLQELSEKGSEMHNATARAGARSRRMQADLDANGGLLTDAERADFESMHDDAEDADPYVSVAQYVEVRRGRVEDAVSAFEAQAGVPMTADQRAAFEAHCRAAPTAAEFQARVQAGPAAFVTRTETAPAVTETAATETAAAVTETATEAAPVSESTTTTTTPTTTTEAVEAQPVVAEVTEDPETDQAIQEAQVEAQQDQQQEQEQEDQQQDQQQHQAQEGQLDFSQPGDQMMVEAARADVLGYIAGLVQTYSLAERQAVLAWLRSTEGAEFTVDLVTDPDLSHAEKAAAARQRVAEWIANFRLAGLERGDQLNQDQVASPSADELVPMNGEDHPNQAPETAVSGQVADFLVDEQGRTVEELIASWSDLPWSDPIKQMPLRVQYEYARYLCTPPHGGKMGATAFGIQWRVDAEGAIADLAATLGAEHVDALRAAYPAQTRSVPAGGPIPGDLLFDIYYDFLRAGDFSLAGNDVGGFVVYLDQLVAGRPTGVQGETGIIVTDRDVTAIAGNTTFGRSDESMNYIADLQQVAQMTPEQYSMEIGITAERSIWPVASQKLRELQALFGPVEGRREWAAWINAHGGFKTLSFLNVIWNGPALQELLIYRNQHAMRGLGEQVVGRVPFRDNPQLFSEQLLGIPLVPGEPIGVSVERYLRQMLGDAAEGLTLDDMLRLVRATPPGSDPGGSTAHETGAQSQSTGASSAVPDSTYHGEAREEHAPARILEEAATTGGDVAAMFGDAVRFEDGRFTITVGERTVTLAVTTSAELGSDVANFDLDAGTITISDRARDKHVPRALAHEIAEILSILQERAGAVTRSATDTLVEGGDASSGLLSHHDIGRVAELRVLMQQLAAELERTDQQPNPVVVRQLRADIEALLDHLGLANDPTGERSALVEAHLPRAELNRYLVERGRASRQQQRAELGVEGETGRHAGVELHSHFMGVVEVDTFESAYGGAMQLLEAIVRIGQNKPALAHDTDETGAITRRGTAGDALRIATEALQALRDGTHPDLQGVAEEDRAAERERIAREVARQCLTATSETDFNSSYEIRDELVQEQFGGELREGETPNQRLGRAYFEFAKLAVRRLIDDGLFLSEQSMSINKLAKRYQEGVLESAIAAVIDDIRRDDPDRAAEIEVTWLSMGLTVNYGQRQTPLEGEQVEPDPARREAANRRNWLYELVQQFGREQALAVLRQELERAEARGDEEAALDYRQHLEQLESDAGLDTPQAATTRPDVVGIDVAGQELFEFDERGKHRFRAMYLALVAQARARGEVLVFRPHVGEGAVNPLPGARWNANANRYEDADGNPIHYQRAESNIGALIEVLQGLAADGLLDDQAVVIRFGHATHTNPDQAQALAELGVIAEVNLGSNVATGSVDQTVRGEDGTRQVSARERLDDHSLLTLIYYDVQTILSTDAHSVMSTSMGAEYERAYRMIEAFLDGRLKVRVRAEDAGEDRGTASDGFVELSVDELTRAELEQFLRAYQQLHAWAEDYYERRGGTPIAMKRTGADPGLDAGAMEGIAARGLAGPETQLPHGDAIARSFGRHDVSDVRAHVGGAAETASSELGAEAYALGDRVAFRQAPDLHTAAHEAAHVVQQRQGVQLKGGRGAEDADAEAHADAVADRVVAGESAEALLDGATTSPDAVQFKLSSTDEGILRIHQALDAPIPPALVDRMLLDSVAVRSFVQRQIENGLKADGKTFFYQSRDAYLRGVADYWNRFTVNAGGEPPRVADEEVLAAVRATAGGAVAVTLVDGGGTIHINVGDGQHEFRVILHEAMHQQMQVHLGRLGIRIGEGFAEYLSEIVLREHGLTFAVHSAYRTEYDFVKYLAEVFGRDAVIRCALDEGERAFADEFLRYARDAEKSWDDFVVAVQEMRLERAREILRGNMVPLRDYLQPQDEAAEKSAEDFWHEADELERTLQEQRDRETWPPEASEPIETRVVALGTRGMWTAVIVPRGGRHGVREGWALEFGPDSDLHPNRYLLTKVGERSSEAVVPRRPEQMGSVGGTSVVLKKL